MQGAQLSSNEAYLGTSKQRGQLQQRSRWLSFCDAIKRDYTKTVGGLTMETIKTASFEYLIGLAKEDPAGGAV